MKKYKYEVPPSVTNRVRRTLLEATAVISNAQVPRFGSNFVVSDGRSIKRDRTFTSNMYIGGTPQSSDCSLQTSFRMQKKNSYGTTNGAKSSPANTQNRNNMSADMGEGEETELVLPGYIKPAKKKFSKRQPQR